jgi:hypothetical protein
VPVLRSVFLGLFLLGAVPAWAQDQAIALGASVKVSAVPQAGVTLYPGETLEIALGAHLSDRFGGTASRDVLSAHVLGRARMEERVVARYGLGVVADDRFDERIVGPVLGVEVALTDRVAAFGDLSLGFDLGRSNGFSMDNTGLGLVYRFVR